VGVPELHLVAQLFSSAQSKDGLNEDEFVEVMAEAFAAPQAKLRVLFRKVDASAVSLRCKRLSCLPHPIRRLNNSCGLYMTGWLCRLR
jgi:hypothetical protein